MKSENSNYSRVLYNSAADSVSMPKASANTNSNTELVTQESTSNCDTSIPLHLNSQEIPAWLDRSGGLKAVTASVFIVGEMAGSGVLALPKATQSIGLIGMLLLVVCCFCAAYTGSILGKCWIILQERYPEYRVHNRFPYPAIGFRAYGPIGRYVVSVCNNITLFGVSTVFLLMAAEIIQDLAADYGLRLSGCIWMLIITAILTPFSWLGSPKDMWPLAIGAMSTTILASLLIFVQLIILYPTVKPMPPPHSQPDQRSDGMKRAFMAFGTMVYAFGNHPIFPTIQHDMTEPKKFTPVVVCGMTVVVLIYLPIVAGSYFIFGDNIGDNILGTISIYTSGIMLVVIQALFALHLLFVFVIAINPFCQEIEELVKVDSSFTWKRAAIRTVVVLTLLFVAESVPKFGAILSLVGGSTTALLAFILPCLFYTKLCDSKDERWCVRIMPLHQRVFHYELIAVAVLAGAVSSYSAIEVIVNPHTFVAPCYINSSKFL